MHTHSHILFGALFSIGPRILLGGGRQNGKYLMLDVIVDLSNYRAPKILRNRHDFLVLSVIQNQKLFVI